MVSHIGARRNSFLAAPTEIRFVGLAAEAATEARALLILGICATLLALLFTPILPLDHVIDLHDKAVKSHLLRAQLLFDASHRLE